jgi:hypothetical protein
MRSKKMESLLDNIGDRQWGNRIDEMAAVAVHENWFPEAKEIGPEVYVKMRLRQMASKKDPETGLPLLGSIVVVDEKTGKKEQRYKQLSLFEPEDYIVVCKYHNKMSGHHKRMAKAYAEDCYKRFGVQLYFDFEMAV